MPGRDGRRWVLPITAIPRDYGDYGDLRTGDYGDLTQVLLLQHLCRFAHPKLPRVVAMRFLLPSLLALQFAARYHCAQRSVLSQLFAHFPNAINGQP